MKTIFAFVCILLSGSLFAATDVTSSLEYLFAPMESRYGTSADYASSRGVHCMEYLDGRIYIGGGDWSANTGPVPIISILPGDQPTWTNEYTAGAEHLEAFKKFSDGRIWTRATDPKEGQPNYGHFFAKYPGGDWVRCPLGKVDWNPAHSLNSGLQLYTHSWDICEYDKNFYFTGFGIGGSKYWLNGDDVFDKVMGSVTVGQTNCYYQFKKITGQSGKKGKVTYTTSDDQELERFMTLMPFDNGCIGVTFQWYESRSPDINQCYFWRRNESTGTFAREDCAWSTFMNGAQDVDHELTGSTYGWFVYFRKATPYKGRVYYIATPGCSMNVPIGFYSATMDESGKITSQRHAFDNGKSHVIDISVVGGSMYVMTVKYVSASSIVHGIWKTTDGQNFTQLATFTADQYFESFTYAKGYFYLGYGAAKVGSVGFSVASPSTDKAGQIWRFALPQADDDATNDAEVVTPRAPSVGGIWMDSATITNDRAVAQIELKARGIPVGPVTMRFEVYSDSALTKFVSATNVVVSKQGSMTATVTGLAKKTKYYIRAIATTAGGLSTTSATAYFTTTDGEDLGPVFTQKVGAITFCSATVTNAYESFGPTSSSVGELNELATDASFASIIAAVEETRAKTGEQLVAFGNLQPSTTYYLRTKATAEDGVIATKTTSFTTPGFVTVSQKAVSPSPNGSQIGYTFEVASAGGDLAGVVLTFSVDGVVAKRQSTTLSGAAIKFGGVISCAANSTVNCRFDVVAGGAKYSYSVPVNTAPYTPPYVEGAATESTTAVGTVYGTSRNLRDWDFSAAPWFWGELNVTNMFVKGVTGKGVKVGVVDVGCQPITEGEVKRLVIDHQGGSTGNVGPHGIGVCSIIKSDRFGIAPDCELYAYNGSDFEDDIKGLWWCFTNGCRIVNFSGGYTPFDYTAAQLAWAKEQIRQMLDQGMILVAAGGNAPNETLSFPQDMDGVINIAGIMRDCTSAGLNDNWAKDFAAFGNNVPLYTSMTGSTGTNGGSSFAAPMVTAIAALYLQQNPTLTREELYDILKKTCRKLSEERSRIWGWGLVQADEIPANFKRQPEIDAEKAKWVKATKLTLANAGLTWNETSNWYEIKMYPGQSRQLKCRIEPENASDTNAYWYCGNNEFNIIGTDNVLTIPASLATGRFLVYNCRNVEREGIGNLKVFVVAQGSESEEDPVAADDPEDSWSYSEVSVTNVPDRTAAVMSLFNPASNRWGMADNYANARGVKCLANIDGRIYVGMGDWGSNFGPVPVVSIGIEDGTPTWRQEATIYTEAIDKFKKFSDGRVWAGCVDPRNYIDVMAAKRGDGEWVKTANVSAAPLLEFAKAQGGGSVYSYEHIWDFCEYKGSLFMGGYDIIRSDTWLRGDELMKTQAVCCAVMTNLYNCCYDSSNGYGHKELSRMVSLMPFENGLLCWQLNYFYAPSGEPESKPGIWRYDETTRKFNQELVEWDSLLPDWSDGDRELATSSSRYEGWVNFNDVVSFNGRLYYVVGNGGSEYVSIGFFSASMNATGKVESVNVRLDGGHAHVAAMSVVDGVMYCLAQHPKEDGLYKHSIWKTVDGVAFEKLAEIKLDHLSQAMAYEDGWFYVGLSSTRASSGIASRSGEIIRFSLTEAAVDPTDPVDPPAISVHETEYLWSPAGGSGNWSEAANWRVAGSVAAECPSETDSVVFGSSDSEVVLSANCTISNLTISSVGKHVFRTTDVTQKYTLTCATSVSLSGAGGGTLVVEDIDMSGRKIDDLAGLEQLVITGKGKVYPSTSPTTDIVLVNGGTLYNGGSDLEFKKLKLVGGPSVICFSQYTTKGVAFDSFEAMNGSGVPVVSVKDGRVSFTNTAGIETVGGTSTLASGASTIPVCPNFQIGSSKDNDRQHGRSACTIDNGFIKEIPAASMKDTLDGATELDNVHLGADYTLDHDVTVNALIFNKAIINLGGHVVTVRSGVFREGANGMFNNVITNGIVRLCRPNALGDSTNNTDVRCRVDFFTDDNTDSEKCMVAYNCEGGGWDTYAVYTNFSGTFAVPPSTAFGFKSEMRSPRAVVEMRGGAIRPSAHNIRANLGGISGTGSANYSNWRTLLWLGEIGVGDQDDFNTLEGRIVVANGGFIKPGHVDYDGGRRGCFSIPYVTPQGTIPKLSALEFRDGAKLKVTLRADGTCSWLDASQTQSAGTFLDVTLAGDLVLEEAGRVKSGNGPWIVLKTGKETTGSFANAGANGRGIKGYKVAYNVDLGDGTYGVQVTKKQSGFSVKLR